MKVSIVVLTMGNVHHVLSKRLLEICLDTKGHEIRVAYTGKKNVTDNRNSIVAEFLKTDFDYLLMIDEDNPPTRNPLELVQLNKDVISCPTPIFVEGKLCYNVLDFVDGERVTKYPSKERLVECDLVGTGCILIKRSVLEKIEKPFENNLENSEDLLFSIKARRAGFRLYCHWDYLCDHYKVVNLNDIVSLLRNA